MQDDDERYPSALQAVFIVGGLFGAELLMSMLLTDARELHGLGADGSSALVTLLGNAVVFVIVMHRKRLDFRALFQPARHTVAATLLLTSLPVLLLIPLMLLGLSVAVDRVVDMFPLTDADRDLFERMASGSVASVVATCLLAPVLEEMLFRGIFLRSFLQQYRRRTALLLSATLFGAAHLNVYQFVVAFVLGLVAGWLYERAHSLWPAIVLHAGYNTALMALAAWQDADAPYPGVAWAGAVLCAAVGAVMLSRMLARQRG